MVDQNKEIKYPLRGKLKGQAGEYFEKDILPKDMPKEQKNKLKNKLVYQRINHDKDIFHEKLKYEENPPNHTLYDEKSQEHILRENILKKLTGDFSSSDSAVGRDLTKLLDHCNLNFRIVDDSKSKRKGPGGAGSPNGFGRFNRGEDGRVDKTTIFIHASMFNPEHIDKLPGLLAHELAHVLDFNRRPKGYNGMINGQETFADLTGQIMAEKAGYSSFAWVKYMGDHVRKEKEAGRDGKVGGSPMGNFREKTIKLYEKITKPSYTKDVKNLDDYKKLTESGVQKTFMKLSRLRSKIANPNVPMKDNTEQRNSFINSAKQGLVSVGRDTR